MNVSFLGRDDTRESFVLVSDRVISVSQTGLSLWTVLHVRDDSQLSFVSSLPPPPASSLTRHRILPNPSYGFGGRTLRVVIKPVGIIVLDSVDSDSDFLFIKFYDKESVSKAVGIQT